MPLIIAGIDEAGYGPLLGPLCVGMSVFSVPEWTPGEGAPNLWKLLARGVCRRPTDQRRRIAVEDSKILKGANDCPNRHPLTNLERGVLAFLAFRTGDSHGVRPESDLSLFDAVGAQREAHPWYQGPAADCPVSITPGEQAIACNMLARALEGAGIGVSGLECRAVGEGAFNRCVASTGTKAAVTLGVITDLLRTVWDRWGAPGESCDGGPRVVCDRQGGRTHYADFLSQVFPGARVDVIEETGARSRYRVSGRAALELADTLARELTLWFMPESESQHLPVALASMLAKLVRELMMARFNRYWCGFMPELKPTAGYTQDARRWLRDAAGVLTEDHRRVLIRRA